MESVVTKTVMPDGIRIITEFMPHVRSVSIGAWLGTGSRDETRKNNGISHFLEHMTFKGTVNRDTASIAESLESVGGNLNAFTGKEVTCFYANVLDENAELAVDVLADLISYSLIQENDIQKEKQVILEEISSLEDTPDELVHEYFQKNMFRNHPLSFSVLGTKQNVKSLDRQSIVNFKNERYTTNNLIITAAGNINHKKLHSFIRRYFQIPVGKKLFRQNGSFSHNRIEKVYQKNVTQAHICIGNTALSYSDPRKYALLLLHALLGGGMSSRLFQNIREKYGVAYTIFSFTDFLSDTGVFGVYMGVDKSNVKKSLKLIHHEFERVKNDSLSQKELNRLKSQLKGSLMLGFESTHIRMNRLAKMELYLQKYFSLDQVLEGINAVKSPDLNNIASEILNDNTTTTIIAPK